MIICWFQGVAGSACSNNSEALSSTLNAAAAALAVRCALPYYVYVHLLFWHVSPGSASRNKNVDYEPFISQSKLPEIS